MHKKLKIILAAIAYMIIAQIINTASAMMTMNYYLDPNYFAVWSKVMMPTAGPPPIEFTLYSIVFVFITGLIYSFVYSKAMVLFKTKSTVKKGLKYGFVLFLLAGIPFFFSMYLMINLPLELLLSWLVVDGLLVYLIGGIAIAKIMK